MGVMYRCSVKLLLVEAKITSRLSPRMVEDGVVVVPLRAMVSKQKGVMYCL